MTPSARERSKSIDSIQVAQKVSFFAADGSKATTISERINEIGFGWFQVQVFIQCAGYIVAESTCMQACAGISVTVADEFGLKTQVERSVLMMLMFCGLAIGTVASGPFGDAFGRRLPMLVGYIGMMATWMMIYVARRLSLMLPAILLLGVFAGVGLPAAIIALTEVIPDAQRGLAAGALGMSWVVGELWAAGGLCLILPDLVSGRWRLIALWSAAPALALVLLGLVFKASRYDTPHFLAVQGRHGELVRAMSLIAEMNGRDDLVIEANKALNVESSCVCGLREALQLLCSWPYLGYSGILGIMFFAKDLGMYGMAVFWPMAWAQVDAEGGPQGAVEWVLTASLGLPGVVVAMFVMDRLPRRLALSSGGLTCAVACLLLQALLRGDSLGFAGVVVYKLAFPSFMMTVMLLPGEVFPTQVRVWAWAFVAFVGRLAAIVAPILVNESKMAFLRITASCLLACAMLAWLLPETKDCELQSLPGSNAGVRSAPEALSGRGGVAYGSVSAAVAAKADVGDKV